MEGDGLAVAKSIERALSTSELLYKNSGRVRKWWKHAHAKMKCVYTLSHSTLWDRLADVIILPMTQAIDHRLVEEIRQDAIEAGIETRRIFFVNCFGIGRSHQCPDVHFLKPEDLWKRLSGVRIDYQPILDKDEDLRAIESEFVDRKLINLGPAIGEAGPQSDGEDAIDYLLDWVENPERHPRRGLIVSGERGTGKTWLLKRLYGKLMEKHRTSVWCNPAPVFVPVSEYAKYLKQGRGLTRTLTHYLVEEIHILGIGQVSFLEALIASGHIVVLLDGLDELSCEVTANTFKVLVDALLGSLPENSRVILTTRGTKFSSTETLANQLLRGTEEWIETRGPGGGKIAISLDERRYNTTFRALTLQPFSEADTHALKRKMSGNESSNELWKPEAAEKTNTINVPSKSNDVQEFLTKSIREICQIPASCRQALDPRNKRRDWSLLAVYEFVLIKSLLAFNLVAERAVRYTSILNGTTGEARREALNLPIRMHFVGEVATYLLEQGSEVFDDDLLASILTTMFGGPYETLLVDLRSQSVFEFAERDQHSELKFRLPGIRAFFVARQLFLSIAVHDQKAGLERLGLYSLTDGEKNFFRCFCEFGAGHCDSERDYAGLDDYRRVHMSLGDILERAIAFSKEVGRHSVWNRYLVKNFSGLGLDLHELKESVGWSSQAISVGDDEVLVRSTEGVAQHFTMGDHEITNREFREFLEDELVPVLTEQNNEGKRVVRFEMVSNDSAKHPLSWRSMHQNPGEDGAGDPMWPFKYFTNAYHLFQWTENGCYQGRLASHPVVWVSMYVCAIYCNWKTMQNMEGSDCCYEIGLQLRDEKTIPFMSPIQGRKGFRLPSVREWKQAARGGDQGRNPWDLLVHSKDGREREKGRQLKNALLMESTRTQDIRKSSPNGFGIFGMVGNVREWAHASDAADDEQGRIMGATWALGEESFDYEYEGSELPPSNTNLDVGFRVARSIFEDF
jgi:formylglycine-generating enzyme required for sulfatase activity